MNITSLAELREKCGMSQTQLAAKLGVHQGTVSKWESSDVRDMPIRRLSDYLWALGLALHIDVKKGIP